MPLPLSVCIITLNEEDNLERCLKPLDFASEIVIVDSGSKDKTVEIAKRYKAKVHERKFDDYVSQKNYALSLVKNRWILTLDADEEVSPELKREIEELFRNGEPSADGYSTPRLTWYLGKWIRHGGWYPNRRIRLFQKSKGEFGGGLVHETVQLRGTCKKLNAPVHHYSYKNIGDHIRFINAYSELTAQEKHKAGKTSGLFHAFWEGFYKAFWMYTIRFGFLDGKQGFILAIFGFYYNFLKYIKLYEMNRKDKKSD
ncbi:glycosyltransferase family 2 protein [Leptospira ellisii]|uniref:Glycosyl transferase n=1 Tax=Leptospira ellisii TaxID=2023197 RepID=A0A2N0B6I0_9LEPT|nr:glycosyltransferase family 2 protein [Leptospira ellisii]MDV6235873.1 glycosyltransferase family 2 protein [Leptospira ellisii]PJZ92157.1 glycosyl transferase [Leptospira ellisii]PKA05046.1 glycosyl transferase [Leptospira ellisii]